ncbi:hypothetical protein CLU79DRAFT_708646, partial [Phycomyces nitens]
EVETKVDKDVVRRERLVKRNYTRYFDQGNKIRILIVFFRDWKKTGRLRILNEEHRDVILE